MNSSLRAGDAGPAPDAVPPVTGLILAGGRARRMGGADKAMQILRGRPMLAWAIERLSPQVSALMISTAGGRHYSSLGTRIVTDEFAGAGPLAGMLAGLRASHNALLATVPCDAPFFPMDLVSRLLAAADNRQAQADIAIAVTADGRQPVFALLRRSALPALSAYLAGGGRKADGWYAGLEVTEVLFEDSAAFANINTPEQLAALNQASHGSGSHA